MNALIDNLMERIHVLTQQNKELKNENQKQKETIERLGSQVTEGRSTGVAEQDHGSAGQAASLRSADRVVGLLRRQDGAGPLAGDGHVAPRTS
jgi:cell division septum initiation protein DivIVA